MFGLKIVAGAATLLLTVGVMSASSLVSADASGTDEGPCITAVYRDDPTIKAQRGNCPVEAKASYSVDLTIGAMGSIEPERGLHIYVRNQTSGVVLVDTDSRGVEQIKDQVTEAPTYEVTVRIDGQSFSRSLTAADFTKTSEGQWTLAGNIIFDSVAYTFLDDFSAEPALQYGGEPSDGGAEQVVHQLISATGFLEPYPVGDVRLTAVNQVTGKVVFDETKNFEGGGEFRFFDRVEHAASDPIPTYLLTLTAGGKTYTRVAGGSQFYDAGDWDGLHGYVAEDYRWFKDGVIGTYDEVT